MNTSITALLTGTLLIAGCGTLQDSRLNPGNWFGNSTETKVEAPVEVSNPLIPETTDEGVFSKKPEEDNSSLITTVSTLRIERTSIGAIISVEGLPTRLGAHSVELRPVEDPAEGVLELEFRVEYPTQATPAGNVQARTVRAAYSVSNQDLDNVRLIRVIAAENVRETRRR